MKRLNIYLAGACKGLVDEGTSWRNEAFERFILAQKYLDLIAYHLYDPTEYFPTILMMIILLKKMFRSLDLRKELILKRFLNGKISNEI